ncbi:hypothetical protein DPMN_083561 [Dreissena polymorpha]|uniref:Uncharacterized protein n=1 Tax=Dreissena polymorpha TaxID=45954 RepID=A0A9D4BJZ0_DREPO|nr:hypothetical protein DPMN_083561 [Dreissena polymorpha]
MYINKIKTWIRANTEGSVTEAVDRGKLECTCSIKVDSGMLRRYEQASTTAVLKLKHRSNQQTPSSAD